MLHGYFMEILRLRLVSGKSEGILKSDVSEKLEIA